MGIVIILLGAAEMIANFVLAMVSFVVNKDAVNGTAFLFNMLIGLVLIQVGINTMKIKELDKRKSDLRELEHRVRNLEKR